ncbi:hypothetical protein ABPG77_003578, partial [Micractinium sp. CCAP 211/92]
MDVLVGAQQVEAVMDDTEAGQGSQAEEGAQGGQQGGAPQQRAGVRDLHEQRIQSRLELVSMQADVQAALHTLLGGAAEVPVLELPAEMLEVALKHPVLRMAVDRALEAAARRMAA